MHFLEWMAEQQLARAEREGAFANLPGAGRPLPDEDLTLVPEDVRVANRILRNAGFVPPEVDTQREIAALLQIATRSADDGERRGAATRLALLEARLEASGHRSGFAGYRDQVMQRLGKR